MNLILCIRNSLNSQRDEHKKVNKLKFSDQESEKKKKNKSIQKPRNKSQTISFKNKSQSSKYITLIMEVEA